MYIGAPDIKEFAPPDSYIDASDMMPEELSERLQHLADNPMEYMNYHAWRRYVVLLIEFVICLCKGSCSHDWSLVVLLMIWFQVRSLWTLVEVIEDEHGHHAM